MEHLFGKTPRFFNKLHDPFKQCIHLAHNLDIFIPIEFNGFGRTFRCTDTTAVAISDLVRGVTIQRVLGWSTKDVESDVNFVFDLVWRGISA